jgi:cytoskeletal protein CcmA (bactofilin family)
MGFFKDFKDDISQAVNDLLPADASKDTKRDATQNTNTGTSVGQNSFVTNNDSTQQNDSTSQSDYTLENTVELETAVASEVVDMYDEDDNIDKDLLNAILTSDDNEINVDSIQTVINEDGTDEIIEELTAEVTEEISETVNETKDYVNDSVEDNQSKEQHSTFHKEVISDKNQQSKPYIDSEEVTIIAKGTTISGNISSDCSLEIMGTIKGDVTCAGKLSIIGSVIGTCMAAEVYVASNRIEGCINSDGSVKIGLGTVIIGDIAGTSAVIAGAVKGDIDVNGPVIIDSSAVIKGNIKAQTIQINHGAIIEGMCSTSYASVDVDSIFE